MIVNREEIDRRDECPGTGAQFVLKRYSIQTGDYTTRWYISTVLTRFIKNKFVKN